MITERLYVLIPTYNEESNIESVINQWFVVCKEIENRGALCRIVVANDGSKDETLHILKLLSERIPILEIIDKENTGHGATIYFLYRYAIESGADFVFQTDSDGQTLPEEFFSFWESRKEYDFIIGNRIDRKDGIGRIIVTKILQFVLFLIFGVWVKDANCPFRLMRVEALKDTISHVPSEFSLTNVAISSIAVKTRKSICWKSITFQQRQGGANSINFKRIVSIGIKALSGFKRINQSLNRW